MIGRSLGVRRIDQFIPAVVPALPHEIAPHTAAVVGDEFDCLKSVPNRNFGALQGAFVPAVLQFVKKVVEFRRSSYGLVHLQTDADFPRVTVGKNNTGLLKGFLYLENRRKVSLYDSIILLDALKCRQANPRRSGELSLAPAQKRPPSSDLRRISHPFGVFSILYRLTIDR